VVALLVLTAGRPGSGQEVIGLPVGAQPDAAAVEDLDGNAVELDQYIGQGAPVLVEFWATWCANCKALEPQIEAVRQAHGSAI
jgi:thiol-disulfide isomerase/thioredoxin